MLPVSSAPANSCLKALYIDGDFIDDVNAPDMLKFAVDYLKVGAEGPDTQAYNEFVGDMDEFAVYEGILTPARISAHYLAGLSDSNATYMAAIQADNPLLWLRFEEASTGNGQKAKNKGSADVNGVYTELGTGLFSKTTGIVSGTEALTFPDSESDYKIGAFVLVDDPGGELSFGLDDGAGGVDVTVELWAKFVDVNSGGDDNADARFFSYNGSGMARGAYAGLVTNDPCQIATIGGSTWNNMTLPANANDGQWHHYVFTYDSTFVPVEVSSYAAEVKKDDPVVYIQFNDANVDDDSNNNYWTAISPLVEIREKPQGAMGNAAWLGGGWVAVAPQTTEPALPTDFSRDYRWSDNEDLTVEYWFQTPQPTLVDNYCELWTDCNTLMEADGVTSVYRPYASRSETACRMGTGDRDGSDPQAYCFGAWVTNLKWHHHVVIWDVNENPVPGEPNFCTLHWYKDGSDVKDQTYDMDHFEGGHGSPGGWSLTMGPEMDHFLLGGHGSRDNFSPGDAQSYQQYVDEFAIYGYVLPKARVEAHFAAWAPQTCAEVWERGVHTDLTPVENKLVCRIDRNHDCKVDFLDFAALALDWAQCNNPQGGAGCSPNW
jgi:hypothetical protein